MVKELDLDKEPKVSQVPVTNHNLNDDLQYDTIDIDESYLSYMYARLNNEEYTHINLASKWNLPKTIEYSSMGDDTLIKRLTGIKRELFMADHEIKKKCLENNILILRYLQLNAEFERRTDEKGIALKKVGNALKFRNTMLKYDNRMKRLGAYKTWKTYKKPFIIPNLYILFNCRRNNRKDYHNKMPYIPLKLYTNRVDYNALIEGKKIYTRYVTFYLELLRLSNKYLVISTIQPNFNHYRILGSSGMSHQLQGNKFSSTILDIWNYHNIPDITGYNDDSSKKRTIISRTPIGIHSKEYKTERGSRKYISTLSNSIESIAKEYDNNFRISCSRYRYSSDGISRSIHKIQEVFIKVFDARRIE